MSSQALIIWPSTRRHSREHGSDTGRRRISDKLQTIMYGRSVSRRDEKRELGAWANRQYAGGLSLVKEGAVRPSDIARVEAHLRATLGSDRIRVVSPKARGGPVEVYAGREFLGTLHKDDEDGEVSYSLHLTILEEDLPPAR